MKNKLVKSMSMIIAIAMLIAMVPAVVSADTLTTIGTVSVEIGEVNETTGSAQVTVTASDINGEMTDYTLLALRSTDEVAVADLATMEDGDLEAQIEYIDQDDATLSEGKLTASFTLRGADLAEMKTRTNEYGDVITVLLGGTGVEAKGGSDTYEAPKTAAPAVSANKTAIYKDEAIEITVTNPATGYMAAAKVKVDGTEITLPDGSVVGNVITIPANTLDASENAQAITIECEGYKPTTAINVTVSAVEDRFEDTTLKGLSVSAFDPDNADALAVVTVPEGYTDEKTGVTVAYVSYAVDGGEATDLTETTFEVARNAEGGEAKSVVVNVKLTYGEDEDTSKTVTATVTAKGVVGYTVVADDVNIVAPTGGAYKRANAKLITVKLPAQDAIDITTQVVKIGGNQLYYTPERTKDYTGQNEGTKYTFVGLIIDEANAYTTAAEVAAATTIESGTLTNLYYGLPANTVASRGVVINDLIAFVGAYNADAAGEDSGLAADKLISMDVFGAGSANINVGIVLVGAYNSTDGLTKDFAIFNK